MQEHWTYFLTYNWSRERYLGRETNPQTPLWGVKIQSLKKLLTFDSSQELLAVLSPTHRNICISSTFKIFFHLRVYIPYIISAFYFLLPQLCAHFSSLPRVCYLSGPLHSPLRYHHKAYPVFFYRLLPFLLKATKPVPLPESRIRNERRKS